MTQILNRVRSWMQLHPDLVATIVFVAITVAAMVAFPGMGLAARRPR